MERHRPLAGRKALFSICRRSTGGKSLHIRRCSQVFTKCGSRDAAAIEVAVTVQSLPFEFERGEDVGQHQDLVAHPISEIFPNMDPDSYGDLVEDIRAHGLHTPITLFEGK